MKDNMNDDKEISESLKKIRALSPDELAQTRRHVRVISRVFGFVGVSTILVMLFWPGIFSIIVGGIITFVMSNLAISADIVTKQIDATLSRFKKA